MLCVLRVGSAENKNVGEVLRSLGKLESIVIADQPYNQTEEHSEVLTEFDETKKKVGGRYEMGLPWKARTGDLRDNIRLALTRLEGWINEKTVT